MDQSAPRLSPNPARGQKRPLPRRRPGYHQSSPTTISGNAPLATASITVNGVPLTLTWTGISQWTARTPLQPGANNLIIEARNSAGISTGTANLTIQYTGTVSWPALRINEWMASNPPSSGITDPADGQAEDWLELYNPTATAYSLEGWFLSDEPGDVFLFRIPAGFFIPAQGHRLIWADGQPVQNNPAIRQDIHAGFKLGANGEPIILTAPDGTEIDRVAYGPQTAGIARRRSPDGSTLLGYTLTPSPGTANPATPPAHLPAGLTYSFLNGENLLSFLSSPTGLYEAETSLDLTTWTTATPPTPGTGLLLSIPVPNGISSRFFLRIRSH